MVKYIFLLVLAAVVSAVPLADPVIYKLDETRYQYMRDDNGVPHLVDLWVKTSDLRQSARYTPDSENIYHLFTRSNPSVSQPLLLENLSLLQSSNYNSELRTIVLIHGWLNDATSNVYRVLVPAFLGAEDCNVIVVDWSAGASDPDYAVAVLNTVTSGESVARFLNWLCTETGVSPDSFHIAGHSLGGQQSGIVGRNLDSKAAYITALDPAMPAWVVNDNTFNETDGIYTEVIHTNAGDLGFLTPLAQVDFYPNGGRGMTGCITSDCDHSRAYYYFGESIVSGGFKGTLCESYQSALNGTCDEDATLNMGGIEPKTGSTGVYYLETNADQPFSME